MTPGTGCCGAAPTCCGITAATTTSASVSAGTSLPC
jgi:hypothetical protein